MARRKLSVMIIPGSSSKRSCREEDTVRLCTVHPQHYATSTFGITSIESYTYGHTGGLSRVRRYYFVLGTFSTALTESYSD